jgi:hypothetical protein
MEVYGRRINDLTWVIDKSDRDKVVMKQSRDFAREVTQWKHLKELNIGPPIGRYREQAYAAPADVIYSILKEGTSRECYGVLREEYPWQLDAMSLGEARASSTQSLLNCWLCHVASWKFVSHKTLHKYNVMQCELQQRSIVQISLSESKQNNNNMLSLCNFCLYMIKNSTHTYSIFS